MGFIENKPYSNHTKSLVAAEHCLIFKRQSFSQSRNLSKQSTFSFDSLAEDICLKGNKRNSSQCFSRLVFSGCPLETSPVSYSVFSSAEGAGIMTQAFNASPPGGWGRQISAEFQDSQDYLVRLRHEEVNQTGVEWPVMKPKVAVCSRHLRHLPSLSFSFHPKGCFLVLFHLRSCPLTLGSLVLCYNSTELLSCCCVFYFTPI